MKSQFGIFTTDIQLVVRTWDPWLEVITSRSAADVCEKRLTDVFPEIENRGLIAPFRRALEQGAVELLSPVLHGFLITCPPPPGTSRFPYMQQRIVIAPLRDGAKITGVVVTIEDVTLRRENELEGTDQLDAAHWRTRKQASERVLSEAAETPASTLINRLRKEHRNPGFLNSVLPLLASGAWESLNPLIELTHDADAEICMYAALALGDLKDRRAIPALLALLESPDTNVKYHAIEALSKLRASEAVDALIGIVESGEFYLAFPALDALAAIGDQRIAARLVPLLDNGTLSTAAIGALAELGDHSVVRPLLGMMDQRRLAPVVAQALATLYQRYELQFGEGEYVTDLVAHHITPAGAENLLQALNTTTGDTLRAVVRVLGWIGGEAVTASLTRLLGSPALRSEIVETFVRQGATVTSQLAGQLESDDLDIRRAAATALGRIGDPESVPHLVRALVDPELTVDVAGALARIGDGRAYEPLLGLLAHERGSVRQAALAALNSLGDPRMPEDVQKLLKDPDPHTRESAVRIAGYFGYPECVDLVLERVDDADENVRRAAVESLPNLHNDRVPTILKTAIRDDSAKTRAAAAQAIGDLESVAFLPELIQSMSDSNSWVRYYAARSLGRLASPEAIDALSTALRADDATQVRIAAADALGAIGGSRVVSILAPFVASDDPDLARAALLALGDVGHPDALHPILGELRSSNASRRLDAVRAIASRRDNDAAETLQWTAAADHNETVSEVAIEQLGRMATPESIAALLRLTADRRLREKAIVQISRLGHTHLEKIKSGLSSPELETRRAVVEALGRMKHPAASETLSIALDDDRPEVRLAALLALRRLGSHISERKLWNLAERDPDPGVREAAGQSLKR